MKIDDITSKIIKIKYNLARPIKKIMVAFIKIHDSGRIWVF